MFVAQLTTLPLHHNTVLTAVQWVVQDLEVSGRGLIWALSRHVPGESEENHKAFQDL